MSTESPEAYFEALAARGWEPRLAHVVGTWQVEIDDGGTWSIHLDHGALRVERGPDPAPTARLRMSRAGFLHLAGGAEHENLVTALLRGEVSEVHGDPAFLQMLGALLPMSSETGASVR